MNLIKNSSIALTIGLAELTFRSREMGEYTFRFFEAFSAATLIYVVIAMTANRVMALVERKVRGAGLHRRREIGGRMTLDFDVISALAAVPVEGLPVHGPAHGDRLGGRHLLRHAARARAAVGVQVLSNWSPRATST